MIAFLIQSINKLGYEPRTQAYMHRRTKEGMSKAEVIRCLKRYVAREIFSSLRYSALIRGTQGVGGAPGTHLISATATSVGERLTGHSTGHIPSGASRSSSSHPLLLREHRPLKAEIVG